MNEIKLSAEERKRIRLEKWKQKQQQSQEPAPKVSLSIGMGSKKKKKKAAPKKLKASNPFFDNDADDEGDMGSQEDEKPRRKPPLDLMGDSDDEPEAPPKRAKTSSRWDNPPPKAAASAQPAPMGKDALDRFMEKLEAGALGTVTASDGSGQQEPVSVNVGGSMMRPSSSKQHPVSGGVITALDIEQLGKTEHENVSASGSTPIYIPNDWLSDASDTEDQQEEEARRALIEALKSTPGPALESDITTEELARPAQLASEVKTEKSRREERLRQLERNADEARQSAQAAAAPELGRLFDGGLESGVMEEAERSLEAAKAAPDALLVLAELNKKKELKAVDHSQIDYLPFQKNLYRVPRALAGLSNDEITNRRAKLKVRVRGHGAPAPVSTFEECGLSERIVEILEKQGITTPYPVQAQCIPCIMAGRDVIGIAKTGSGKTLAYLLPLFRHILVQPPLENNESGPIGLILAPARELAYQIHIVCKGFAKQFGLNSTAIYGGAGVAEQIADLKRGTHVVVATPGRLIDILTMHSGKILSLQRVTYICLDEADRMCKCSPRRSNCMHMLVTSQTDHLVFSLSTFTDDMGFAPQISAIVAAVRPDRQTVLFSATFPKAVEILARKSLKYPVEIMVGGRSVASDSVTQYAELVDENEKFLRLLQLLGEQVEGTNKIIIFVDTQVRADSLFEQLLRNGYPSLSLHGGKEQEDRDSTISDFKRKDGPNVLVATGVAGRGLDVQACSCVINYSAPNHLEAYVHQVGRTGRAGHKGVAYTFVNPTEEAKYAPIVVRALSESGEAERISPALKELSDEFKAKVEKGEAKFAGSGFKGKGYTYDSTEMNDAQKMARLEKRQALIEAGLLDPEDDDPMLNDAATKINGSENNGKESKPREEDKPMEIPANLTPELLALPGMKEALLRKAGILPTAAEKEDDNAAAVAAAMNDPTLGRPVQMGHNHYLQELEINDYPMEARWKVTQRDTTSRLQDEFRTAVTLKGTYFGPGRTPAEGDRKLYLHLEATSEQILKNCVAEIQRLLNDETLRVGAKSSAGGGSSSHKYNVL